jgi:hypothetical protein
MKQLFPIIFIAAYFSAQGQNVKPGWLKHDTDWFAKTKVRYLGMQSNPLLQQFLSLNGNGSINSNPYLFSYSSNDLETGKGFAFGSGFSINQSSSNDGIAAVTIKNTNVSLRLGWEQKYFQQSRFIPFVGIDGAFGVIVNNTTTVLNQSFNNSVNETQTIKAFIGSSARGGVHYAITKHVLLGTEFFFNLHIAVSLVTVNNDFASSISPTNIGFEPPTALFLIFRY